MTDRHSTDGKILYCSEGMDTPVGLIWDISTAKQVTFKPRRFHFISMTLIVIAFHSNTWSRTRTLRK